MVYVDDEAYTEKKMSYYLKKAMKNYHFQHWILFWNLFLKTKHDNKVQQKRTIEV